MSDSDGDDLTDEEELYSNTMMFCADTDGDGLSDGEEVDLWFDPTNANYDGDSYDDKEELENDTSPFVYDLNLEESAKAWGAGVLLGDFDVAENTPTLLGQITGSFIPFIDARDLIANIKHTEFKAAIINIIGLGLDMFTGPGGSAFDVSKAFSKLGRYVAKYSDDAPKVVQAITKSAEYFPEAEKVIPDLVKVLPAGAIDDLADSVKSSDKITKSDYQKLSKIFEAGGKNIDDIVKISPQNLKLINGKINRIAKKYKNLECMECSDEIVKYLQKNNMHGQKVMIEYGNGYVINELYSTTEAISHNGKHSAVLFNVKVFDNLFPEGIDYDKWKSGFYAISGELKISFMDF